MFIWIFFMRYKGYRKISRKHPFYHHCIQSLRMVFRDPTDLGAERTKFTPSAEIIEQNLLNFQKQWTSIASEKMILTPLAMKEIRSLLLHIRKGCLSGIPPGHGTNRS